MLVKGEFDQDIETIQSIEQVPRILDVCSKLTGMRFVTVARVTEDRWVTCASLDLLGFGLVPGSELPLSSTICDEIRDTRTLVVFDDADKDDIFRTHHTPRIYGLKSYISVPIVLENGSFFGTLCGIDSVPRIVNNSQVVGTFQLFADLIASQIDTRQDLRASEEALLSERELAKLREQFIAVLGHDLRNPLASIKSGLRMLKRPGVDVQLVATEMAGTANRMSSLIENLLDFARARLGSGVVPEVRQETVLPVLVHEIVQEIHAATGQDISVEIVMPVTVHCDPSQIGRMISNLANNAIVHGSDNQPVRIILSTEDDCAVIAIQNNGEPIPADKMPELFEPFVRGASTSANGLGLGLYISSQIAKAHGGTLTASSDAESTVFTFRMPY